MILSIQGISVAFGLQWQVVLRQGAEEAIARKAGATLLWADRAGQYVGLLPPKVKRPSKRTTVYAGAQLILRATTAQNLLYVSEVPAKTAMWQSVSTIDARVRTSIKHFSGRRRSRR
ncbi:hypothetical protein ACU4GI_46985 (plasmid) [Cupriavidus basilensis]